ncbi:MAG TPA: hypothetical protein VLD65_03480 [Anaerolineales bacterium]|nr:hypothetical protein [Anaerolineales bacterium]
MMQKITNFINLYEYLLVALFLAIVYMVIAIPFGYLGNVNQLMFSTPDAQSYLSVEHWILGASDPADLLIRPMLYPALLIVPQAVGGNHAIWGFQFLLWVGAGCLLYRSIKLSTGNLFLASVGIILYAGNFTLLLLTLHALTEITVIFMLTILVSVVLEKPRFSQKYYWPLILFIVSLLTITKPVFIPLWVLALFYSIFVYIKRLMKQKSDWTMLVYIILASLPVLFQIAVMKINFDQLTISNIGPITFKTYYLAKVYEVVNSVTLAQARQMTATWGSGQIGGFIANHLGAGIQVYLRTIVENFLSRSNFTASPAPQIYIFSYMRLVNILYFTVHVLMVFPTLKVLFDIYRKKLWDEFEQMVSLIVPMWIIVVTSGITFSQGDRILLPALPIWIVLYACILSRYFIMRGRKMQTSSIGTN